MSDSTARNGIDLEIWDDAKEQVRMRPDEAKVIVRTVHRWIDGFAIESHTKEIESAGEITERAFEFRTDWPEDVGGSDSGPSPGEALLGALGGCVGLSYIANAVSKGVVIDELEIEIDASADLQRIFEAGDTRPGLSMVDIKIRVRSGADDRTLVQLGKTAGMTSTVFDSLASPVPINLEVETLD